jgi:ATP-dependent protease ClpP protease subunit
MSTERIAEICERNTWLTAPQMKEHGLIDQVLTKLPVKAG